MSNPTFAETLAASKSAEDARQVNVLVSYDVIKLFSEQLYTTPVKAIEELVVNGWDAGARNCSVLIDSGVDQPSIAVFDDGDGMTLDQLENLWHIGVSSKTGDRTGRKLVGKFGIGKLASYAVARRATYISKTIEGIFAVAIDFEAFAEATGEDGTPKPVTLQIRKYQDTEEIRTHLAQSGLESVLTVNTSEDSGTALHTFDLDSVTSWTLVILEDLKEKAQQLKGGRLRWVLETAMPLAADFTLFLGSARIMSSKSRLEKLVEFSVASLDDERLAELSKSTGETWERTETGVRSPSFPSGITGDVFVTKKSLYAEGGKSEDLGRSHGFFVRVRNRLINETDPLFGARPLSFTTWYRFAAIVEAEDLNPYVTAARDDVEQSAMKRLMREFLVQVFNQARDRYEQVEQVEQVELRRDRENKEGQLDYVSVSLVERPLADALAISTENRDDSSPGQETAEESLESWRFLEDLGDVNGVRTFLGGLYEERRQDKKYRFRYSALGAQSPFVRLNALSGEFTINEDHELTQEFSEQPQTRRLLETFAAAEALLEVYLRETELDSAQISHLIDRRDLLIRSLARDESSALPALARGLRDSVADANNLEIALVGALRALGFAATHIGGSGTPDGEAGYIAHGSPNSSITLEAKSSKDVPSLGHLDFAGLRSHYERIGARGCLLIAPTYPGIDDTDGEVSERARQQKVSCWTIDQLARVVEVAEARHLNAKQVEDIVLRAFAPLDVEAAIEALLTSPTFSEKDVYRAVLQALRDLQPRLKRAGRNVSMVAAEVSRYDGMEEIEEEDVARAVDTLAKSSRGMLHLTAGGDIQVLGDLDELERRVAGLADLETSPRRRGSFKE